MQHFAQALLLSNQISLIHDTKFGNCRCKIVDSRVFPIWSLIHGSSWSGLIKAEPGRSLCFEDWVYVDISTGTQSMAAMIGWHCTGQLHLKTWWRHQMETFPRYRPFVRGIHQSPVNSPHKGKWRGTLMFSLICAWPNNWVNNHNAGGLRRHRAHYDVTVMTNVVYEKVANWSRPHCVEYPKPKERRVSGNNGVITLTWIPL